MSNNGTELKIPIKCDCGQVFSAKLPQPDISNLLSCSIVVAVHEQPIKCVCGQQFVLGIDGAQVSWAVKPMPRQSGIVIPKTPLPKLKIM